MQDPNRPCPDFEIRFCCDENLQQFSSVVTSLNYSESDFSEAELKISQGFDFL